jgi:hypothetical protein
MSVVDGTFDHPLELEEHAAMPLAGGISLHGCQCGMVWGAALAAGAAAFRRFGAGPRAEARAVIAARRAVDAFRASNGTADCVDITGIDISSSNREMMTYFFLKGGVVRCFSMAARYAPVAFKEIEAALSEADVEAYTPPVSCAAVLARRMGASDLHTVMASGLAGGIGLSGGGCGALGAAVWLTEMEHCKEGDGKLEFPNPRALKVIDRFMACTNPQFECVQIVGRRFESIEDHASFLRDGGCSDVIEALAAE